MQTTDKWLVKKRLKTMLLFCSVLFTVFFVMSWISYQIASRSVNQQIEDKSLPLNSDNIYSQIQRDLVMPMFIASLMAHDTFVRDWALLPAPPVSIRSLARVTDGQGRLFINNYRKTVTRGQ